MHAPIERRRFGEITYGNKIVFTVDGEDTFKHIYDAISKAESSIYIAGYDLDPSLNFVREGSSAGKLNDYTTSIAINGHSRNSNSKSFRSVKESVKVDPKSLEERDQALSISGSAKSRQNPNSLVTDITTSERRLKRFQELIIEKARKGAIVRIIVWQPRLPLRILPGADEGGLMGELRRSRY